MNKPFIISIALFICVSLLSFALIASIQVPIFLAGGSDSLEVIVQTSHFSQWLALALFLLSWFLCFLLPKLQHKYNIRLKIALISITLSFFLMSGHNFRYSGKQHALIDTWFFIPTQTISIDPTGYIENTRIEKTLFSIIAYRGDTKLLDVFLGLPPWRLNEEKVVNIFHDLGFKKTNQDTNN